MSPPTIDLSLPSNDQLLAAAAPNPETEAALITATGDPDQISAAGARLQRLGSDLDHVHRQSTQTQEVLGGSFTNNGGPVYDPQTHQQLLPAGFPDAGTRLHDAGRRVVVVAVELSTAMDDVNSAQAGMWTAANSRRMGFAAEVDAARGPDGLIPAAQVPALQARRSSVAAGLQELVNSCGRDVVARVGRYQTVLEDCRRLLGELGLSGTVTTRGGLPGTRLEGQPQPGEVLGTTVPAPGGPSVNIFPLPPRPTGEPGFTPLPAGGPVPLITLPAPDLGSGVSDGPGSGQRVDTPPIRIDADTPPGTDDQPAAPGGVPDPDGKLSRVDEKFLKKLGIDPHDIKGENDLRPPSHFDIYLDKSGNMFGVRKGNDPQNGEFLGNIHD